MLKIIVVISKEFTERSKSYAVFKRILYLSRIHEIFLVAKKSLFLEKALGEDPSHLLFFHSKWKNTYLNKIIFNLFALTKMFQLNIKLKTDIIYTLSNFDYFLGLICKRLLSTKWVVDVAEHPEFQRKSLKTRGRLEFIRRFYYSIKLYLLKRTLRYADLVIVQGTSIKEGLPRKLIDSFLVNKRNILALPLGVDLEMTKPNNPQQNKEDSSFKVIYSGYLSRWRGIDNLLVAISKIDSNIPDLKMLLVGPYKDKEEKEYLENMVKNLGLNGHVEYKGYVPHETSLGFIEVSDVCVCPFPKNDVFEQAYSLKIPEYLAMGKAVIATNLECIRAYIKNEENGLLIDSNSPDELANAILRLYREKSLREKLERNARKSVLEFDWNKLNAVIDKRIRELK